MKRTKEEEQLRLIWHNIKGRCNIKTHPSYKNYGGRGIRIEKWNNYHEFTIWSLNNGYEFGLSIDRIDNNNSYSPDNCRWVEKQEQHFNKRSSINLTIDDVSEMLEFHERTGESQRYIGRFLGIGKTTVNKLFNGFYLIKDDKVFTTLKGQQ